MTGLPECFTKKQQLYHDNKLLLLILDFSAIGNSQDAVTTAKTLNEFADGIIKYVENLSSGCLRIDILCDSYFDNSLKSHTRKSCGCGQLFPFTEATNIPNDFQGNFLRHNRNKVAQRFQKYCS